MIGTLFWIGLFLNPFLAYRTGYKTLGRVTLLFFFVYMLIYIDLLSGTSFVPNSNTVWWASTFVYLFLLVVNSCLVSKRYVPELTAVHWLAIGFVGFGISYGWHRIVLDNEQWTILFTSEIIFTSLILSLVLLLVVALVRIDRRVDI